MTKWEYKWHVVAAGSARFNEDVDKLMNQGCDGWELVSVVHSGAEAQHDLLFFFKRPMR